MELTKLEEFIFGFNNSNCSNIQINDCEFTNVYIGMNPKQIFIISKSDKKIISSIKCRNIKSMLYFDKFNYEKYEV